MTATEETLLSTETLALKGAFWHQSIYAVKKSGSGDYPVGEHRIDLRCKLERGLLQGDLLVGENPTEHLNNLDFTIQLRGARKIFSAKPYPSASGGTKCCSREGGLVVEQIAN